MIWAESAWYGSFCTQPRAAFLHEHTITLWICRLVESPKPPMRLPLGTDTLQVIRDHIDELQHETAEWAEVAASTDYAAA